MPHGDALRAVVMQLAQAAAHEINNPLTVISAHLQRLQLNPTCLSDQHIEAMLGSVRRIRDVVAALREVNALQIDPRWQELSPMLDLGLPGDAPLDLAS